MQSLLKLLLFQSLPCNSPAKLLDASLGLFLATIWLDTCKPLGGWWQNLALPQSGWVSVLACSSWPSPLSSADKCCMLWFGFQNGPFETKQKQAADAFSVRWQRWDTVLKCPSSDTLSHSHERSRQRASCERAAQSTTFTSASYMLAEEVV